MHEAQTQRQIGRRRPAQVTLVIIGCILLSVLNLPIGLIGDFLVPTGESGARVWSALTVLMLCLISITLWIVAHGLWTLRAWARPVTLGALLINAVIYGLIFAFYLRFSHLISGFPDGTPNTAPVNYAPITLYALCALLLLGVIARMLYNDEVGIAVTGQARV